MSNEGRGVNGRTPARVKSGIPSARAGGSGSSPDGPLDPFAGLREQDQPLPFSRGGPRPKFGPPRPKPRIVRDEPRKVDVRLRDGGYIIDGRSYPRVSDILDALPREWLLKWYVKQTAEHAAKTQEWRKLTKVKAIRELKSAPDRVRDQAAERGTRIHAAIAVALSGELERPELGSDEERQCVDRALKYIKAIGFRVEGIETVVWSDRGRYAGTCDVWGRRRGSDERELLDWKSGSGVYFEHAVQIAAYMFAEHAAIGGGEMIPSRNITRGTLVHVTRDGCTEYPIVGARALVDTFLAAREVWTAIRSDNPNGLGKPTTYHFTGFESEEGMPTYVSEPEGSNIPPHPEGQFAMRCIDVIDYGDKESTFNGRTTTRRRGVLRFFGGEYDEEGHPLWVDAWFTLSLHQRANLRKFLEVWRGMAFTEDELKQFDLDTLIGAPAFIQVRQNASAATGRVYANIDTIMKLPKNVEKPPMLENYVKIRDREPEEQHEDEYEPAGVAWAEDDDLPF